MQIANCGRGLLAPRSSLVTLWVAPRSGLSLTEVLIAMGILTLGLLGVAAIFPVASFYMYKADISDRGSAIAQSVMNDILSRGILKPSAWYVATPHPMASNANEANFRFVSVDGKYTPNSAPVSSTFTRPFAEALSEGLKYNSDPIILARQFGSAYVIDPMFAAAAASNLPNNFNVPAYPFPASAYSTLPYQGGNVYYKTKQWDPWRAPRRNNDRTWPIRRVTFQQSNGWPVTSTMADYYCRGSDDLATDFPDRDDRPSMQNWDTAPIGANGAAMPVARQWAGDYSWIVSVAPTTSAARNGMARNPESFEYDVSVVVFHKRPLPAGPAQSNNDLMELASNERSVSAKVISTGMNGGELLLTDLNDVFSANGQSVSAFRDLRVGQWIMLCGPHPNSSSTDPRFALNWYQVLAVDTEGIDIPYPATQRLVTVRGPQWPWLPRATYTPASQNSDAAQLSDDLCVVICKGAVAVHSKTIRLESPRSGAYGSGMAVVVPPGVTPPGIGYH